MFWGGVWTDSGLGTGVRRTVLGPACVVKLASWEGQTDLAAVVLFAWGPNVTDYCKVTTSLEHAQLAALSGRESTFHNSTRTHGQMGVSCHISHYQRPHSHRSDAGFLLRVSVFNSAPSVEENRQSTFTGLAVLAPATWTLWKQESAVRATCMNRARVVYYAALFSLHIRPMIWTRWSLWSNLNSSRHHHCFIPSISLPSKRHPSQKPEHYDLREFVQFREGYSRLLSARLWWKKKYPVAKSLVICSCRHNRNQTEHMIRKRK